MKRDLYITKQYKMKERKLRRENSFRKIFPKVSRYFSMENGSGNSKGSNLGSNHC